jgi:DNA-binding NarL/FixJ family response regulator
MDLRDNPLPGANARSGSSAAIPLPSVPNQLGRRRGGASDLAAAPRKESMMEQPLQVMVVVQQPIFREGVIAILNQMAGCEIIGQPQSANEALELARTKEPDVALLDTFFDSMDTLEIAKQMRISSPRTAVIMLSELEGEEWLFQAVKVGAAAYYTRNITPEELVAAIQKVSKGEYLINDNVLAQPNLASRVLQSFREMSTGTEEDSRPTEPCPLSGREVEILEHIAKGNSNKEIAKLLDISDQTVKNHITSILRKLEVNDRTAAVVYAIKQRWIKME